MQSSFPIDEEEPSGNERRQGRQTKENQGRGNKLNPRHSLEKIILEPRHTKGMKKEKESN